MSFVYVLYGPAPKVITPRREVPPLLQKRGEGTDAILRQRTSPDAFNHQFNNVYTQSQLVPDNFQIHNNINNERYHPAEVSGFCYPNLSSSSPSSTSPTATVYIDDDSSVTQPLQCSPCSSSNDSLFDQQPQHLHPPVDFEDADNWSDFFGDSPLSPAGLQVEGRVLSGRDAETVVASPGSSLGGRSSLFEDVENSFTPQVEHNLSMHLSATPPKDIRLPEVPISCHEPLLQFQMDDLKNDSLTNELTELEVLRPHADDVPQHELDMAMDDVDLVDDWFANNDSGCSSSPPDVSLEEKPLTLSCESSQLSQYGDALDLESPLCDAQNEVSGGYVDDEEGELSELPGYLRSVRDPKRKMCQNREAAQRYRHKKRAHLSSLDHTLLSLRTRKQELKESIENKRREVAVYENLLKEMKGNEGSK